ncbi:MAG: hypothetical protein EXR50_06990 [Dehalococcoidia bacterium]|nr:hypothetical protein [Dehalococcoidia bacterium]
MSGLFLLTASFLASSVEMVEALTIILATGITRGWRSALIGAALASVVLALIILVFGAALTTFIPLDLLRLIVGGFLLIFGMQWLRKSILRYAGLKALHDEDRIFREEVSELSKVSPSGTGAMDWVGFTVAFKGVLLEGLEVAFIVITFGSSAGSEGVGGLSGVGLATAGAVAALILVLIAGLVLHRPLAKVPENTMKFAVGLVLMAFGTFWGGEGAGIEWAWGEGAILALLVTYGALGWGAVHVLRREARATVSA